MSEPGVSECGRRLREAVAACSAAEPCAVQQSATLLRILRDKEKKKQLTFSQVEGTLPVLLAILEQQPKNSAIVRNVVLILKEILTAKEVSKQCSSALVQKNGGQILLSLLLKHREIGPTDVDFTCALYSVLAKLACRDRKLAVRARQSGALKIPLEELQQQPRAKPRVARSAVQLLRRLLTNKPNATALGKEGLVPELLRQLENNSAVSVFTALVLECLAWAMQSKRNVLELAQHGRNGPEVFLRLLHDLRNVKASVPRRERLLVRALKANLQTLLRIAFYKAGRSALLEAKTPEVLLAWCTALPPGPLWDRLTSLACLVVQRCLPPLYLPVLHAEGPLVSPLPRRADGSATNVSAEAALRPVPPFRGKGAANDDGDSASSPSTTASSSELEADTDEELDTAKGKTPVQCSKGLDVETYARFFPELELSSATRGVTKSIPPEADPAAPSHTATRLLKRLSSSSCASLLQGAREAQRAERRLRGIDRPETFVRLAQPTESVVSLVKLPYPDVHGHDAAEALEPLCAKCNASYRSKILRQVQDRLKRGQGSTGEAVYDYDDLVAGGVPFLRPLCNTDEDRVSRADVHSSLKFESRFESGNLRKAIQRGPAEYDLVLNPDINTNFHHQWFYFEVSGMHSNLTYTFNIINFERSGSLYTEGMRPLLYSVRDCLLGRETGERRGWQRVGEELCYFRNQYARGGPAHAAADRPYYTFSFDVRFPHDGDVCYLAYAYPYTYSLLKTQLHCWELGCDESAIYYDEQELCKSLGGNPVPVVTITAQPPEDSRPYVFLSARVHPGETQSSWIMKGVLDFLMSSKPSAQRLRETFVFKVVPMLNPDGVINGCHRCSLTGQDLNRQWLFPDPKHHPIIHHSRALLEYLSRIGKTPVLLCDFHGHSRRFNVFLYGCSPTQSWCAQDRLLEDNTIYEVFPVLLHHVAPAFSYDHCCFDVEHGKESTARVTAWRQFGVRLSYTLECSAAGCDQGMYAGYHLGIAQLEEMGVKFCQALGRLGLTVDGSGTDASPQLDPLYPELIASFRNERSKKRNISTTSSSSLSLADEDDAGHDNEEGQVADG